MRTVRSRCVTEEDCSFRRVSDVALPFLYGVPRDASAHDQTPNKCSAEEGKNHGFWEKADCDPVAYFTLWLVGFTGVLALSTIGLWLATKRAANRQIQDTETLQRAYLTVEPGGIIPYLTGKLASEDGRVACQLTLHNAGNLPARAVSWRIIRCFSKEPRRKNFPIWGAYVGNIVIAARQQVRHATIPLTRKRIDCFVAGGTGRDRYLYVWGRVNYSDGFGKKRFTDFCHRYNLSAMHGGYAIAGDFARYHENGNRTDEG